MIELTEHERSLARRIQALKNEAGSHSPSLLTLQERIPELKIRVDACFLSNPLATDLFVSYLKAELITTNRIRDVLEFYPSQNQVIGRLLAQHLDVSPERIFIGNGAIEIIQAMIHRFTRRRLLVSIPTFSSYYEFAPSHVEVVYHQLREDNHLRLNVEAYLDHVRRTLPDTVVLINPNNPDGGYIPEAEIRALLDGLRGVDTVIIDESFIHFAYESEALERISSLALIERYPNLTVLKSMSKDFGIAGIRAGFAVTSKARVDALLGNGFLWNSNGLAEYFFRLYTRPDFLEQYEQARKQYITNTQTFLEHLSEIPALHVFPSKANFALVRLPEGVSSSDLVWKLLISEGVYMRTCSDKIGLTGEHVRISSRTAAENVVIIDALRRVLH